jgi:ATP-binding cassette subfamily B protein
MSEPDSKLKSGDDPSLSTGALIRRMLGLAWEYRLGCIRVLLIQILLLTLGMLGLGLMGLGVDYIRYELAVQHAASVQAGSDAAPAAVAHTAKPPRWPFGLTPPADTPRMRVLAWISLSILLFALVRSVLNIVYTLSLNRLVQSHIVVTLRARVYDKMQRLSFRFFDANASGSLINRVTGDVQSVRSFVDGVVMQTVIAAISLVMYFVYMVRLHPGLTLACLATTPVLGYMTSRFTRAVKPAYNRNRELFDDQVLALSESVQGVHVVKGFARQAEEIAKFDSASDAVRDQKGWIFRKISNFQPCITFLTHVNLIVLMGYGGHLAIRYELAPDVDAALSAGLSIGQLLVFSSLLQEFSAQIASIANIANTVQQSLIGARRVFEVLDAPMEITSPPNAIKPDRVRGEIAFENVGFGYKPEDLALENISFRVEPGEVMAVLGTTGAGKSTLLSLIPRFYDPCAGRVRVDGHDVREFDTAALRRQIGIVFQESFLFSTSVHHNIAFGHPSANREQVERAARIASAHEFIMEMPDGYDTVLREGGTNLSGGQRQRLAIARAILLEPSILLLDDPTAAVDPGTEGEILTAMERAMQGRTTFIVAHRLSTLRRADRVVVLDGGRLVQMGTHRELMRTQGQYRRAARLQIPDAESLRLLNQNVDTLT